MGKPPGPRSLPRVAQDVRGILGVNELFTVSGGARRDPAVDAWFAQVNTFTAPVNIGFFQGAALKDPAGLLQGKGKHMRHVQVRPGEVVDAAALEALICTPYADIRQRLGQ
jgi:hypothetical protein